MNRAITWLLAALAFGCVAGEIFNLNEAKFDALVEKDESDTIWLLDFYAPWCGHCKRLNPVLDELDLVLPENIKIGKIDATKEKRLAGIQRASAFPTIKYRKNGKYYEYEGIRDVESFQKLFKRLRAPAVTEVSSASQVRELIREHGLVFLLHSNDESTRAAFQAAADTFQARGIFILASSDDVTHELSLSPSTQVLAKLELNMKPYLYNGPFPLDQATVEEFYERNDHRLITQMTQYNYRALASKGKTMALLLVDYDAADSAADIARFTDVAMKLPQSVTDKFVFGHIDGVRWEKYFNRFEVSAPFPKMLFTRPDAEVFFHDSSVDLQDLKAIQSTLERVASGELQLAKTSWASMFKVLAARVMEGGQLTWMTVFSVLAISATIFFAYPRDVSSYKSAAEEGENKEEQEGEGKEETKAAVADSTKPKSD